MFLHILQKYCAVYIKFSFGLDFLLVLMYTVFIMFYSIKALKLKIIKAIK